MKLFRDCFLIWETDIGQPPMGGRGGTLDDAPRGGGRTRRPAGQEPEGGRTEVGPEGRHVRTQSIKDQGSRIKDKDRGSRTRIKDQGSRIKDPGSTIKDQGSRIKDESGR